MKSKIALMAGLLLAGTIATQAQAVSYTNEVPIEAHYDKINDDGEVPVWVGTQEWQRAIQAALEVYPNPSNGVFTVKLPEQITVSEILLYDLTGRIVQQRKGDAVLATSGTRIDLSEQQNGMYLLVLRNGTYTFVHRIVKLGLIDILEARKR
jgi:hypothetical protein